MTSKLENDSCFTKNKTLEVGNGEEFHFFLQNHTWDLVKLPFGKKNYQNVNWFLNSKPMLMVLFNVIKHDLLKVVSMFLKNFIETYSLMVHFESKFTLSFLSKQLKIWKSCVI
jgi:hypothetical protein